MNPTIHDILSDEELAMMFRDFLRQLQCVENLSFYVEAEDYKRLDSGASRKDRAGRMWARYFSDEAATPLNVDSKCRQRIAQELQSANSDLFDEACEFAFSLLSLDCYRKFIGSEAYLTWLSTSSNNRSAASGPLFHCNVSLSNFFYAFGTKSPCYNLATLAPTFPDFPVFYRCRCEEKAQMGIPLL